MTVREADALLDCDRCGPGVEHIEQAPVALGSYSGGPNRSRYRCARCGAQRTVSNNAGSKNPPRARWTPRRPKERT